MQCRENPTTSSASKPGLATSAPTPSGAPQVAPYHRLTPAHVPVRPGGAETRALIRPLRGRITYFSAREWLSRSHPMLCYPMDPYPPLRPSSFDPTPACLRRFVLSLVSGLIN